MPSAPRPGTVSCSTRWFWQFTFPTRKLAPHSYEAWIDYDVCGTRMSRMELDALRKLVSASGAGLEAKSGASLDKPALDAVGPSRCELEELVQKLSPMERPDSELDVSKAKSAEHFADRMNAAVPKVDKAPPTE